MEICSLTSESPTNCRDQIPILGPPPIANPGACFCVLLSLQVCLLVGKRPHWGFLQHRSLPACLLCRVREFGLPASLPSVGADLGHSRDTYAILPPLSKQVRVQQLVHPHLQSSPAFTSICQNPAKGWEVVQKRSCLDVSPLLFASATALLLPTPLCLTPRPERCLPQR